MYTDPPHGKQALELSWEHERMWQEIHSERCDCLPDDDGPCFYSRERFADDLHLVSG